MTHYDVISKLDRYHDLATHADLLEAQYYHLRGSRDLDDETDADIARHGRANDAKIVVLQFREHLLEAWGND